MALVGIGNKIIELLDTNEELQEAINEENCELVDYIFDQKYIQYENRYYFYKQLAEKLGLKKFVNTIYFYTSALSLICTRTTKITMSSGETFTFNIDKSASVNMVSAKCNFETKLLFIDIFASDIPGVEMEWEVRERDLNHGTTQEYKGAGWNNFIHHCEKNSYFPNIQIDSFKVRG